MLAYIWHYWIGFLLFLVALLAVVQLVVGYVRKVVGPQYPNRRQKSE